MQDDSIVSPIADGKEESAFWTRLLHRWFVEYNPFYMLSAALVLTGTMLWSRGFAQEGSVYGSLCVAAVAEIYAVSLIGGAALLMRIGQRRPAIMLALLMAVYEGDPTLHTETCAYLSRVGAFAAALWLLLFVVKLRALAWAMRVRISPLSFVIAVLGALGLVIIPHALPLLASSQRSSVIAFWLLSLLSLFSLPFQKMTSTAPLDAWGAVVFRRAVRATWLIWSVLIVAHVFFWSTQRVLELDVFFPALALLGVRWIRRESGVWLLVTSVLVFVACMLPETFSLTAVFAAIMLGLRTWPRVGIDAAAIPVMSPYRAVDASRINPPLAASFVPLGHAERHRALVGSIAALYLALWTLHWSGGPWPAHVLAFDLAMTLAMLLVAWRANARIARLPPIACVTHYILSAGLVPVPRSLVAWGETAVAVGFLLLFVSLGTSYRLRKGA